MSKDTDEKKKTPRPVDVHVGVRIRIQRNMLDMSQDSLGKKLGISFQQVQKYEKGLNRVGASRLQEIADILQVKVSFFFEGINNGNGQSDESSNSADPVMTFIQSKQGLDLNKAFIKIKDDKVRDKAVQLIKAMAENDQLKKTA